MSIEQFVPSAIDRDGVDRDTAEKVSTLLAPGRDFKTDWAAFMEMRRRVNFPRRRIGGDINRVAPVLFNPAQFLKGD